MSKTKTTDTKTKAAKGTASADERTLADRIYAIAAELETVLRHVGATGDPASQHYAEVVTNLCVAYGKTVAALAADVVTQETAAREHVDLVNRLLNIPTVVRGGKIAMPTEKQIAAYRAKAAKVLQ